MSSFLLHRRSLASVASWLTPILTSAQHFWAFITCVLHRGEQGAEDGGGVTVASSTSSLTGNAKALVMLLLKHPLQGQSIWIRDISQALDLSADQVTAAVDCLGWNAEPKKWLKGGKTAARLEIADPMQLETLAASFCDSSSVPALSQTRAARVKAKAGGMRTRHSA